MNSTMATAAEPDPHVCWAVEIARLEAQPEADNTTYIATCNTILNLQDRLASTQAGTLDGVAVQLQHVLDCQRDGSELGWVEEKALENALATIKQLAGRA